MARSSKLNQSELLQKFIEAVYANVRSTSTNCNTESEVHGNISDAAKKMLGPASITLAWDDISTPPTSPAVAEFTTVNVFYLFHLFALKLTQFRKGQKILIVTNDGAVSFSNQGYFDASFKSSIFFKVPIVPAVGQVITDSDMSGFLTALKNKVTEIQASEDDAVVFQYCHSSCHTSCHGSRGRR